MSQELAETAEPLDDAERVRQWAERHQGHSGQSGYTRGFRAAVQAVLQLLESSDAMTMTYPPADPMGGRSDG